MVTSLQRRLLSALEPVAALPWFSPEFFEEMTAAGFPGWSSYFCSRAAPLGPIPAEVGVAVFYNWNPAMVRRELRWDGRTPADAYAAFVRGARRALERVWASADRSGIPEAADLLREAADACPHAGRPVFSGFSTMPWPDEPAVALWHAAMLLREFRGDTHNAVLLAHGLHPIEALLLNANRIEADLAKYLGSREWTLDDAKPYLVALQNRAYLDADGRITEGGAKFREMIEIDTDRRSMAPVEALGVDRTERVLAIVEPLAATILEQRAVPGIVGRVAGRARA